MRRARLLALLLPLATALGTPGSLAAAGHTVRITTTLDPARLTTAPGDTVTFRNDDDDRHRIRSESGPGEFDSGNLEPGETFRIRLTAVGTYAYLDERDDDDRRYWGRIVVSATAGPAPSDGDGDGSGGSSPDGSGGSSAPTTATIGMADRNFSPGSVTIAAGGSVTWQNDDDREHTASSSNGAFDSGVLAPGATHRETFPAAGTFPFLCFIHPEMTGTVKVTGGGGAPSPPEPATRPAATPAPPLTPQPDTQRDGSVAIVDLDFEPRELEIGAGGSVTWENTGVAPHTATAGDGSFDSGQLSSGAAFTQTFAMPGRFAYACAIHPAMTGVVVVRAPSPGGESGSPPPAAASPGASPGASRTAGPTGGSPSPSSSAPSDGAVGSVAGQPSDGAPAKSSPDDAMTSLIGTLLALGLVCGALMVGTGLLLGIARRGGGSAEPAG